MPRYPVATALMLLLSAPQKKKAIILGGHTSGILDFAFSRDSRRAATVSKDGTWRLHDLE